MTRHTKTWMGRGGGAPFQSFDTSGRSVDGWLTTRHTPPIEKRFGPPGCARAPPEEEGGLTLGVRVVGPQAGVCTKRYKGFDDTSIKGRARNKSRQTACFFSK